MGIFDMFTNKNAQDAANIQSQGAERAYGDLSNQFAAGRGALQTNYTTALQPFIQAQQTGKVGTDALGNALGLNGPQGNAAATQAFWNNPAIQSQLDIGSQNVLRNEAATGQLASGKTNVDLQNLGQQTASQGWNQYIQNLLPFLNYGLNAAGGGANVLTGLGSGLNQSFTEQGKAAYGADTSSANAQANAALAKNQGLANLWGLGTNIAKGLTGMNWGSFGGGGGGDPTGGGGGGSGILGTLGSIGSAAMMFSDKRLKEETSEVGELYDGQKIYKYRYLDNPVWHIGMMAQDVEKRFPQAVEEVAGFKAVDYNKATEYAARLGEFLNDGGSV
jgi:hypothetical protein